MKAWLGFWAVARKLWELRLKLPTSPLPIDVPVLNHCPGPSCHERRGSRRRPVETAQPPALGAALSWARGPGGRGSQFCFLCPAQGPELTATSSLPRAQELAQSVTPACGSHASPK